MKYCLLCKFEFVQCSAWFFDQATGLVFLLLSNQRLLECVYGIYRDRHFICSGDMCSLPSHPGHSSRISSCCDVLLHCLILGLYCEVYGFLSKLDVWYYIIFSNQRLLEGFPLWYYKNRHVIYFWIHVKSAVMPWLSRSCCS